jgi:sugar phosphate permease
VTELTIDADPAAAARGRHRYVVLLLLLSSYAANAIDRTNLPLAAIPLAGDLHLSASAIGVIGSAFFWGGVVAGLPGGLIAQRVGAGRLLVAAMILWSVSCVVAGLAAGLPQLVGARALLGLAEGATGPVYVMVVSRWFPRAERGQAIALLLAGAGVSATIGFPLTGLLIAHLGWRAMFFAEAVLPLAAAGAVALWLSDEPGRSTRIGEAERSWLVAALGKESPAAPGAPAAPWYRVLSSPVVWIVVAVSTVVVGTQTGIDLFQPTVIRDLTHQGIVDVSLLAALPVPVGMLLLIANGRLSDRFGRRDVFVLWPLVVAGVCIVLLPVLPSMPALVALLLTSSVTFAVQGPVLAWLSDVVAGVHMGGAVGFKNLVNHLGDLAAPLLVGFAAVAAGGRILSGVYPLAIGIAVAVAAVVLVPLAVRGARPAEARP